MVGEMHSLIHSLPRPTDWHMHQKKVHHRRRKVGMKRYKDARDRETEEIERQKDWACTRTHASTDVQAHTQMHTRARIRATGAKKQAGGATEGPCAGSGAVENR